jgi:methylmalonyl-CoA mutase, C-terminal domain
MFALQNVAADRLHMQVQRAMLVRSRGPARDPLVTCADRSNAVYGDYDERTPGVHVIYITPNGRRHGSGRAARERFGPGSGRAWPTLVDMVGTSRLRVVIAKPGLDGHDRGAKVVARALRDAGVEVVYTGLHQTPEQVVETAIQEDADAIGLSILSGAHMTLFRKVLDLLDEREARDILVFGGGIIPDADIPLLEEMGVPKIFTPGATTREIVDWVDTTLRGRIAAEA